MKIQVWRNNLYLIGTVREVMKTLKSLSKEYTTVEEVIKGYLH